MTPADDPLQLQEARVPWLRESVATEVEVSPYWGVCRLIILLDKLVSRGVVGTWLCLGGQEAGIVFASVPGGRRV